MTTSDPTSERRSVLAAGGVVLEGAARARRVLVVHRPRYDDWSLPKGHVDAGEDLAGAAIREVAEETGITAVIAHAVGTTEHTVATSDGPTHKRVHWFVMEPDASSGDPSVLAAARAPDAEVDRAEWWPIGEALQRLTHDSDRALLRRVVATA